MVLVTGPSGPSYSTCGTDSRPAQGSKCFLSFLTGYDSTTIVSPAGPAAIQEGLREALAQLAALALEECPFQFDPSHSIPQSPATAAGLPTDNVDARPLRRLPATLADQPRALHGDIRPPNLVIKCGRLSGFLDLADPAMVEPARGAAALTFKLPPQRCRPSPPAGGM